MLVAILSDIHANLEALEAVISDLENRRPAEVVCLGDLIGYGPDPDEVVGLVRSKGFAVVMGNHEAALADRRLLRWFNFQARDNAIETGRLLSSENREFCRNLPRFRHCHGARFVHGFPPDSPLVYLNYKTDGEIISFLSTADEDLFFVGHTHRLIHVRWDGIRLHRDELGPGVRLLDKNCRHIINVGSVGQPRGGDRRANYLLWDIEEASIETIFVSYDRKKTAAKIIKRGFPNEYAYFLE